MLDIGTSKICCYIVRPRPGQDVQLLGRGYQLAEGLQAGEIVDAEAAETSILAPCSHEAEQQAGETLREIVRRRQRRPAAVRPAAGRLPAERPQR